jgi:hypothetical protein
MKTVVNVYGYIKTKSGEILPFLARDNDGVYAVDELGDLVYVKFDICEIISKTSESK